MAALVSIGVAVGALPAEAKTPLPPTHGAMLDSVAALVATDILRDRALPPGRAVRFATPLPGDTMGFLAQRMVEALRARGTEVRILAAEPAGTSLDPPVRLRGDSTDLELQVQVGSAGVSFVRPVRRFPFGVGGYERLASMRAAATLLDLSTRDVLWAKTSSAQLRDEVPKGDLNYAMSGSGGLNPVLPRGGTRVLEPLIVIGVVTGLVVLFYSNRN